MQAYAGGAPVEMMETTRYGMPWYKPDGELLWNWRDYDYRIAPQPKIIPLEAKDLPTTVWFRNKNHVLNRILKNK